MRFHNVVKTKHSIDRNTVAVMSDSIHNRLERMLRVMGC